MHLPATSAIIAILALVSLVVGGWHVVEIMLALLSASPSEWGVASFDHAESCQGTSCHAVWRNQFLSCNANRDTTFRLRYLTVGIVGLFFGYLGLQGIIMRNSIMVKSFAVYLLFLAMFIMLIWVADNMYVLLCGTLPLNMQRDIGAFIPWETLGVLHAQGYRDLSAFKAEKLKEILGYDFLPSIALAYAAVSLAISYFSWASFRLSGAIESGPVGLGPNFLISTDSSREITQMKDRLLHVAVEQMNPLQHYEALGRLQDGNEFPYTSLRGSSPAMQYGTSGAAMPLRKESQK